VGIVRALMENGADPTIPNREDITPIAVAKGAADIERGPRNMLSRPDLPRSRPKAAVKAADTLRDEDTPKVYRECLADLEVREVFVSPPAFSDQ
jgi:hypothetical protein